MLSLPLPALHLTLLIVRLESTNYAIHMSLQMGTPPQPWGPTHSACAVCREGWLCRKWHNFPSTTQFEKVLWSTVKVVTHAHKRSS